MRPFVGSNAIRGYWLRGAGTQRDVAVRMGQPIITPDRVEQQAGSNIELGRLSGERDLRPVLDNITVPVRYVVASGTS